MELQEQITELETEKKRYIEIIDGLNAEKIALDQMFVDSLKSILSVKKEIILKDQTINNLNSQIKDLFKDKEELTTKIFHLENKERYPSGKTEFIE